MNKNKFLPIPLIVLLLGFPQISETIYTPSLPQVAKDFGVSPHLAELSLSIYFGGFACGVAVWGALCDFWSRRNVMLMGLLIYTVSCLLLYMSTSIDSLLVLRFFQAFGASVGSVVTQTMIRDIYEGKQRTQVFALVGGILAFTPAIGPWLGGYFAMTLGWQMNFIFLALMGWALGFYCLFFLPNTAESNPSIWSHFKPLLKRACTDEQLVIHVLFIAACNGIVFGFYGEAPFLFIELMGLTPSQYGLVGLVLCGAGFIASLISQRLNAKLTQPSIIYKAAWIIVLGSLCLLGITWNGCFNQNCTWLQFLLLMLSIGITFTGIGIVISNSLSIALNEYKGMLGMAGAIFGTFYYIGIMGFTALMSGLHNGTAFPMPLLFLSLGFAILWGSRLLIKEPCFLES